jgi:hypothetical protein
MSSEVAQSVDSGGLDGWGRKSRQAATGTDQKLTIMGPVIHQDGLDFLDVKHYKIRYLQIPALIHLANLIWPVYYYKFLIRKKRGHEDSL